jgi:HTH-type transcriptional repressor of NAD biosynthesis genes
MTRYQRGLVVGKFCPLHRGHMLVIDTALAACDEVFVISYTNPAFDGCAKSVREGWLQLLYPQVHSVVLDGSEGIAIPHNDAPEAQHRDFCGWICMHLLGGAVDAVFTSEDYGDGFARALTRYFAVPALQVAHICVDKARVSLPISGTRLRADPFAHRAFLDPRVYASFVRRVCILGGESSGKTTLARALAARLDTAWVPEFGRELWVEKAGVLSFDDLGHIAQVQVAREEDLVQTANRWLVCDTSPLTTLCYSEAMFGAAHPALAALAGRTYDSVFLCDLDIPFVQDGTRRDTDFRVMQQKWYRDRLDEMQIAYTVLAGPLDHRVRQAMTILFTSLETP